MSAPRELWARAHAKVNLHLGVGERRPDGFHELVSVFQSLSVHDVVSLRLEEEAPSAARGEETRVSALSVWGPHAAGVPADDTNLAWRAVDAVAARLRAQGGPRDLPRVRVDLRKEIPAAGGMAGGSADAAACLRLADELFSPYYGRKTLGAAALLELAADLGSDVPFTLLGGTALGTGRGENLTPMLSRGTYTWAILTSPRGLSTPEVFAKLDDLRADGRGAAPAFDAGAVAQALLSGVPARLAAALHNDMQPAALSLRPDLAKTLTIGKDAGALAGLVSGSGPTCVFLCDSEPLAREVAEQVCLEVPGARGLVATSPARLSPA